MPQAATLAASAMASASASASATKMLIGYFAYAQVALD
jgi:hypothetical protein